MARIGLPQQQYNNQANAINQNQAAAIGAAGNSNNPNANIAAIVRQGDNATGNLNSEDAQARANNLRLAMSTRGQLGQQKLAAQQYNQFDKYSENFNRAQALSGASNANLNNAVNGVSGLASGLANAYGGNSMSSQENTALNYGISTAKTGIGNSENNFNQFLNANPASTKIQNTIGYGLAGQPNVNQYNYGAQWGL